MLKCLDVEMRSYELTCLISPDLSPEELDSFQEKITSFIQEEEGNVAKINETVKKGLAYPIEKTNQAYLTTLSFNLNPENLENLEKKLKAVDQVFRYTIVTKKRPKITEVFKKPSRITVKISRAAKKIKEERPKVELKEIEEKLEEILGE